jgi:hypothetical protein
MEVARCMPSARAAARRWCQRFLGCTRNFPAPGRLCHPPSTGFQAIADAVLPPSQKPLEPPLRELGQGNPFASSIRAAPSSQRNRRPALLAGQDDVAWGGRQYRTDFIRARCWPACWCRIPRTTSCRRVQPRCRKARCPGWGSRTRRSSPRASRGRSGWPRTR